MDRIGIGGARVTTTGDTPTPEAPPPSTTGERFDLAAAVSTVLFGLALVDLTIETALTDTPVRGWVAAMSAASLALTLTLWPRLAWTTRAFVCFIGFVTAIVFSAFYPGGQTHGVIVATQSTPIVLAAATACGIVAAGWVLARATFLGAVGRVLAGLLAVYCLGALALGVAEQQQILVVAALPAPGRISRCPDSFPAGARGAPGKSSAGHASMGGVDRASNHVGRDGGHRRGRHSRDRRCTFGGTYQPTQLAEPSPIASPMTTLVAATPTADSVSTDSHSERSALTPHRTTESGPIPWTARRQRGSGRDRRSLWGLNSYPASR